jgi:hypothetical protein
MIYNEQAQRCGCLTLSNTHIVALARCKSGMIYVYHLALFSICDVQYFRNQNVVAPLAVAMLEELLCQLV